MDNTTKLKEAFKLALAFAIVYGIALKINWLSPSWAGWSVVAIAATSGSESIAKGLLRIWGTILASIIGITIISLGAQNRLLFMILTASWLFFSTYKMLSDKKISYFWFVAGYVCLVITAAGPSSVGGFYLAVFRTLETIMGIVVYTLIAVFLWPRTNIGAIKSNLNTLLDNQVLLIQNIKKVLLGVIPSNKLPELAKLQVKNLGQFSQSLIAEGSENYEIQEQKPLWNQFEALNKILLKSFDRLYGGIEDLSKVEDLFSSTNIEIFFDEINHRFVGMSDLISKKTSAIELKDVNITVRTVSSPNISHFDKAAMAIVYTELKKIEEISRKMVNVANGFTDTKLADELIKRGKEITKIKSKFFFPVFDLEYLRGAFYAASIVAVGFVIWFFVNPPGHSTWYIMGGVFALIFAGAQQVKTLKLIIPFMLAMVVASMIYSFVLPELESFYQLGILLFICMFIIQYFLSGPATAVFTIVILQLIAVNNPQTYNASGLVNSFVFVAMLMVYLYFMSYIIRSPRPEKLFLYLIRRFFKATKYLVSLQVNSESKGKPSIIQQYKTAFYLYELHSIPAKVRSWGKAIDKDLFPNTDYDEIEEMVNSLEVIVVRVETLLEANRANHKNSLIELNKTISNWKQRLITAFDSWGKLSFDAVDANTSMSEQVLQKMNELENQLKEFENKNEDLIDVNEGVNFYHLLGGYRGVTEASLSFVKVAEKLDWNEWKEERFQ